MIFDRNLKERGAADNPTEPGLMVRRSWTVARNFRGRMPGNSASQAFQRKGRRRWPVAV
jgi:hypothetical protein